jgi:hypothetical protein
MMFLLGDMEGVKMMSLVRMSRCSKSHFGTFVGWIAVTGKGGLASFLDCIAGVGIFGLAWL